MKILYKRKIQSDIKNVYDLEKYILEKKIFMYFKKFHEEFHTELQTNILKTDTINFKKFKPWLREVLNYPESIHNPRFLWCMGWEINEINKFIIDNQRKNSRILSKLKKENPQNYSAVTKNQIGFWLNKGYTMDESKNKVSERQKTFSKKICIDKYGELDGLKIFENRQNKWINTLKQRSDYSEIQKKKNIYRYNDKTTIEFLRHSSFLESTKKIIIENLKHNNLNDFTESIINSIDLKRFSELQPYINSRIIQHHFNVNRDELKNNFIQKLNFNPFDSNYGTLIYHQNHRFKSIKEYSLAIFFEKKSIDYLYEINYPNSNRKCDFYIPKMDLYIEYFGMLDGKKKIKENSIFELYKTKMNEKINFCRDNKILLIYDTNFDELLKKINNYL